MTPFQTIVRQTRGGSNGDRQRFTILSEMEIAQGRSQFSFTPLGPEMTLREVTAALIRRGISERDAFNLIDAAIRSYEHP